MSAAAWIIGITLAVATALFSADIRTHYGNPPTYPQVAATAAAVFLIYTAIAWTL